MHPFLCEKVFSFSFFESKHEKKGHVKIQSFEEKEKIESKDRKNWKVEFEKVFFKIKVILRV
jgi:hypothetical protein